MASCVEPPQKEQISACESFKHKIQAFLQRPCRCCGRNADVKEHFFRPHWHWSIALFNFPLDEVLCDLWALPVVLTCCFLMQRLTDDGAAQKLPPSGLNSETAQGDALPTVMWLSPLCFTLHALCKVHSSIFFFFFSSFLSVFYRICAALCSLLNNSCVRKWSV